MRDFFKLMVLFLIISCEGKKGAEVNKEHTSASNTPTTLDPVAKALCDNIQAHLSGDFQSFYDSLCGAENLITVLRSSGTLYRGNGTPTINQSNASLPENTSEMKLWASLYTTAETSSYYKMMRLQIGEPTKFKDAGFESDANIEYSAQLSGNLVSYNYKYDNKSSDSVVIQYSADSTFIEVQKDKIYLVVSKSNDKGPKQTVKFFKGLVVIHNHVDGEGKTEVFSLANQTFDNQKNHDEFVKKAINAFQDDMARAFRNSLNAQKADAY